MTRLFTAAICAAVFAALPAMAQTSGTPPSSDASTAMPRDNNAVQDDDTPMYLQSHRTGAQATTSYSGSSTDTQPSPMKPNSDYANPDKGSPFDNGVMSGAEKSDGGN